VAKTSCRAKLILKCFSSRDALLLTHAFYTFVRLLEFSSIIWSPHSISGINRVESAKRSFTKTVNYLRFSTYEERGDSVRPNRYTISVYLNLKKRSSACMQHRSKEPKTMTPVVKKRSCVLQHVVHEGT
jgi:hypothetical protein